MWKKHEASYAVAQTPHTNNKGGYHGEKLTLTFEGRSLRCRCRPTLSWLSKPEVNWTSSLQISFLAIAMAPSRKHWSSKSWWVPTSSGFRARGGLRAMRDPHRTVKVHSTGRKEEHECICVKQKTLENIAFKGNFMHINIPMLIAVWHLLQL